MIRSEIEHLLDLYFCYGASHENVRTGSNLRCGFDPLCFPTSSDESHVSWFLAPQAQSATAHGAIPERKIGQIICKLDRLTADDIKLGETPLTKGGPTRHR